MPQFPGWDDIPPEACIRCALMEDEIADLHVRREYFLLQVELAEQALMSLGVALSTHDVMLHEEPGDGEEDAESEG